MIGIKLFKEKEYAEQFMKGKIYISAAGCFSKATDAQRRYTEGMIPIFDKPLVIDGQFLMCLIPLVILNLIESPYFVLQF